MTSNVKTVPSISIIVPVYNTEQYLERCLTSIASQSFNDFECVLVNDGSTDSCPKICEAQTKKDTRFRVIHQANSGCVAARMTGVRVARAAVLSFVDSDDTLETCALQDMFSAMQESGAKIVVGAIKKITITKILFYACRAPLQNENIYHYLLNGFNTSIWGKLYAKSCFDSIMIPHRDSLEELAFHFQIFLRLKTSDIKTIDSLVYNYFYYTNSSASSNLFKRFSCNTLYDSPYGNVVEVWDFLFMLLREKKIDEALIAQFAGYKWSGYLHIASLYIILNKTRPTRFELAGFYGVYRKYHKYLVYPVYEHPIVPLCYLMPPAGFFYAFMLRIALVARTFFRKKARRVKDFFNKNER